jgi:hypothetical protein
MFRTALQVLAEVCCCWMIVFWRKLGLFSTVRFKICLCPGMFWSYHPPPPPTHTHTYVYTYMCTTYIHHMYVFLLHFDSTLALNNYFIIGQWDLLFGTMEGQSE